MIKKKLAFQSIPLNYLFWAMEAAFIIHMIDEATVNGGLVEGMKRYFWAGYSGEMFFFQNALLLLLITICIVIYERYGQAYVVAPLALVIGNSIGVLHHIGYTINFWTYSPGLVSNFLFCMILYLILKDNYKQGDFTTLQLKKAIMWGIIFEIMLFLPFLPFFPFID